VSKQIAAELKLPEAQIACGTFRDRVVPAVSEKQDTVFMAQIVRPLAIEMEDQGAVKGKRIPRRNLLRAPRALSPGHFLRSAASEVTAP